jgi:hypothetical protein
MGPGVFSIKTRKDREYSREYSEASFEEDDRPASGCTSATLGSRKPLLQRRVRTTLDPAVACGAMRGGGHACSSGPHDSARVGTTALFLEPRTPLPCLEGGRFRICFSAHCRRLFSGEFPPFFLRYLVGFPPAPPCCFPVPLPLAGCAFLGVTFRPTPRRSSRERLQRACSPWPAAFA